MKNQLLSLIAALVVTAAVAPTNAAAQMPNFGAGMNALIQQQVRLQKQGDAQAMAAARRYYQYALRLRRMGYKGNIPTGVTAESLNATNAALQQANSNYIQSGNINMHKTWNSIDDTNAAITQGCQTTPGPGPYVRTRVCP